MARLFSIAYVDRLLDGETYHDLVELSQTMIASPKFNLQDLDYGLPAFAFLFVETLAWFAQAIRSGGVWTYYESTPAARGQLMMLALSDYAPIGFPIGMCEEWRTGRNRQGFVPSIVGCVKTMTMRTVGYDSSRERIAKHC